MTCFEELNEVNKLYAQKCQELKELSEFVKNYNNILNDPFLKMLGLDPSESEFIKTNEEIFQKKEIKETEIRREIAQYEEKISQQNRTIISYCEFDAEWLANISAEIMSLYEGKNYIAFIAAEDYRVNLSTLKSASDNYNPCLPIKFTSGYVPFYGLSTRSLPFELFTGILCDELEKYFPYVREFIDLLIDYRVKNNKKEITDEELEVIKINFLESKKEEIRNNYIKNNENTRLEMEELRKDFMKKMSLFEEEIAFRTEALDNGLKVSKQKKLLFNDK